jgi:hypothetical protein
MLAPRSLRIDAKQDEGLALRDRIIPHFPTPHLLNGALYFFIVLNLL